MGRTRTARLSRFAVLAAAVLLGPVILAAEPLSESSLDPAADDGLSSSLEDTGVIDLEAFLAGLPAPLSPERALGPHAHWVFDGDGEDLRLRDPPQTGGEIFDRVQHSRPFERADIPAPPEGPEPLLAAIATYMGAYGLELPDLDVLRLQIAALRLVPEAEQALAQLVLAYHDAIRIEAEATAGLSATERALLAREPEAVSAWLDERPGRTEEDLESHRQALAGQVDMTKRLQAADLLVRTIDLVRDPLSLPPAPLAGGALPEGAVTGDDSPVQGHETETGPTSAGAVDPHGDMAPVYQLIAHATRSSFDASTWAGTGDPKWDKVYGLIGSGMGFHPDDTPPIPQETLPQALRGLASTLGVPGDTLELPAEVDVLPESLADALAMIVTARRVGLESGQAATHTFLLLEATRQAQPTLEAWAALLDLRTLSQDSLQVPSAGGPELELFLTETLSGSLRPSNVAAFSRGMSAPAIPSAPPSLATLLEREGLSSQEAAQVEGSLPVPVAVGTAIALDGIQRFEHAREGVLGGLAEDERDALMRHAEVQKLLGRSSWSFEEARLVESWARGIARLDAADVRSMQEAQVDTLASVEAAVAVLGAYTTAVETGTSLLQHLDRIEGLVDPEILEVLLGEASSETADISQAWYRKVLDSLPRLVTNANAQVPSDPIPAVCPGIPSFSQCSRDVWFWTPSSGGILVTGFASTRITQADFGNPRLMIDLGGDDTYLLPAGAADPDNPIRVAMDLGGDDEYRTNAPLAHGAARGFGTLGILWNERGDDVYRMTCNPNDCIGGQGFGTEGGMGVLIDGEGTDLYEALGAWGHGVGVKAEVEVGPFPGTGLNPNDHCGALVNQGPEWFQCATELITETRLESSQGYLFNLGPGEEDTLNARSGQGYAAGDSAIGVLITEGGNRTTYNTVEGNRHYQGGHQEGGSAFGVLIDLGGRGSSYSNFELPDNAEFISHEDNPRERQDDSIWVHRSVTGGQNPSVGVGFGLDSTLESESGDLWPNLVELLAGSDPQDPQDSPADPVRLINTVVDILQNPPDPDDLEDILNDSFEDVFAEFPIQVPLGCAENPGANNECGTPMHLFHLGSSQDNVITEPAQIMIELGGNNEYLTEVAGPARFWAEIEGVVRNGAVGSYALDLSGDDHYNTPEGDKTQGAVEHLSSLGFSNDEYAPVSLLMNLAGNDTYDAGSQSQGAAIGHGIGGSAWLIDFEGDDVYRTKSHSQGHADPGSGQVGLIDLEGDDVFEFETQAQSEGRGFVIAGILGLVFSGGGRDIFNATASEAVAVNLEELNFKDPQSSANDDAFRAQGWSNGGIFIAHGIEWNTYLHRDQDGGIVDLSALKNNVTRDNNPDEPGATAVFADNLAWFTDPSGMEDHDGDGAPSTVETLFGTDNQDPEDHPGSIWNATGRLSEQGVPDPTDPEGMADDMAWVLGLDESDPWLRLPHGPLARSDVGTRGLVFPGMAIAGRGDNTFDEYYGLIVSLGGNNTYTGPGIGGASGNMGIRQEVENWVEGCEQHDGHNHAATITGTVDNCNPTGEWVSRSLTGAVGVSMILDLGGGDNLYKPSASPCVPSLGGATNGVAILADFGGRNVFQTAESCNQATQGAAEAGVGMLLTWNATNRFEAPSADLSQGAASDGFGLLAAFGAGANTFYAPNGNAQGSGNEGVGVLWTGTGSDSFEAGLGSQGHGSGAGGVGILYSGGGNDVFRSLGAAQGAGSGGMGVLINVGGDNQYLAPGGDLVQGAAVGARSVGILMDLGGHDTYVAGDQSQGYGSSSGDFGSGSGAFGMLLDMQGRDTYVLDNQRGHGYAEFLPASPSDGRRLDSDAGCEPETPASGEPTSCWFWVEMDGARVVDEEFRYGWDAGCEPVIAGPGDEVTCWFRLEVDVDGRQEIEAEETFEVPAEAEADWDAGCEPEVSNSGETTTCWFWVEIDDNRVVDEGFRFGWDAGCEPDVPTPGETATCGYRIQLDDEEFSDEHSVELPREDACGLFIDIGGNDHYEFAGKTVSNDRNNNVWSEGGTCGIGVDNDSIQEVMGTLSLDGPWDLEIGLEVYGGADDRLEDHDIRSDEFRLQAIISEATENIDRVSFFANNRSLGQGVLNQEKSDDSELVYELIWDTIGGGFPDGEYVLRASVTTTAAEAAGLAAFDHPGSHSPDVLIGVDNPPLVEADLLLRIGEKGTVGVFSPETGPWHEIDVWMGRDLACPEGEEAANCDPEHPGGFLSVVARNATNGNEYVVMDEYRNAGTHVVPVNGTTLNDDGAWEMWEDGLYQLEIQVRDSGGQMSPLIDFPLVVDGTPPTSSIPIHGWANRNHGSGNQLNLPWTHNDGAGVGVDRIQVFRLNADGVVLQDWIRGANVKSLSVGGVQAGVTYYFVTSAVDLLGNEESVCLEGEARQGQGLCYRRKAFDDDGNLNLDKVSRFQIDFTDPEVEPVGDRFASTSVVRPGADVNFTACVRDPDMGLGRSGIDLVRIRLPGDHSVAMTHDADDDSCGADWKLYYYDEWGAHNEAHFSEPVEGPYSFRIEVFDVAGNGVFSNEMGFIDNLPPEIVRLEPVYHDGGNILPAGRPGIEAEFRVDVMDFDMDEGRVFVDASSVSDSGQGECERSGSIPSRWTCMVPLAADLPDGEYPVTFHATDTAGNTNEATFAQYVVVRGSPVEIMDVQVVEVSHDSFKVEWNTSFEGTSRVDYGRTNALANTAQIPGHRMEHSVEVTGLSPSTQYFFGVVSESIGGVVNRTSDFVQLHVKTLPAFDLQHRFPIEGVDLQGEAVVEFDMGFRAGQSPVQVTLLVQDAARSASPFEVMTFQQGEGEGSAVLDTTRFADGEYRVIYRLDRLGDRAQVESPVFRIDNTPPVVVPMSPRPGATVAEVQPVFEAVLIDPMGRAPPLAGTLAVHDEHGTNYNVTVLHDEAATDTDIERRVSFQVTDDLGQGAHVLVVSVADHAGNVGKTDWILHVDHLPPRVEGDIGLTPLPGPDALKPGGRLHVVAIVRDDSPVSNVSLDLTPLGGERVPLFALGGDRWEAALEVPLEAPDGPAELALVAEDVHGNEGTAGTVEVNVHRHPPRILEVRVHGIGYTSAGVQMTTDQPTRAWLAKESGTEDTGEAPGGANATAAWTTFHALQADGLRPGQDYILEVEAVDAAGHRVTAPAIFTTLADEESPSPVGDLEGDSPTEGLVVLTWAPATDNAGVDHYLVERSGALRAEPRTDKVPASIENDHMEYRDEEAPAGRQVTYRVTAVDVAGNPGPVREVNVSVLALPHLSAPSVSPMRGMSDDPFTFQVDYHHAGGRVADAVNVVIGEQTHALSLIDDPGSCHETCRYGAQVRLPATSQIGALRVAVFTATTDGLEAEPVTTELPLVGRGMGDGGVRLDHEVEGLPGPAVLLFLSILALLGAALSRYRRFQS